MRLFAKRTRMLALLPVVVAGVGLAGCSPAQNPSATGFSGQGGVSGTSASFQFYYRMLNPLTGAGQMAGSFVDPNFVPTSATITTLSSGPLSTYLNARNAKIHGLQLSFNNAPSDICYAGGNPTVGIDGESSLFVGATSCNRSAQDWCGWITDTSAQAQQCVASYMARNADCMQTVFSYTSTNPAYPGTGRGVMVACDGPRNSLASLKPGTSVTSSGSSLELVIPPCGTTPNNATTCGKAGGDANPYGGYKINGPATGSLRAL